MKTLKIPVETGVLPLTKYSGRAMVNHGAVLRTRINTDDSVRCRKRHGGPDGPQNRFKGVPSMAKGMTKTQLVRAMAEKLELTNKQTATFFETLAETAVKETKKNGEFTIPGLGKLVKAERKARIGRNPQTGEAIKIKAKTVVKFRVAKAAKDSIAPPKK
jgi:DNA-binding protein HU-beta